jgi:hypothetical protein
MIGEYLARMHWRAMDRPAYVVGERCGGAAVEESITQGTETRRHGEEKSRKTGKQESRKSE